jgi:small subunit ribosomal protein S4
MARYTGPKCKLCRREQQKLFLKGERCHTAKCPVEDGRQPPGQHGYPRGRPSDYSFRLREKQKTKRYYGLLEDQFRRFFNMAEKTRGDTGEELLTLLERRLDNVMAVCGFAASRAQGRQLVNHGHMQVNSRKNDVASYLVEEGDVIRPAPKDNILEMVRENRETAHEETPPWLEVNDADMTVRVVRMPTRDDVTLSVDEGLVVEFVSR